MTGDVVERIADRRMVLDMPAVPETVPGARRRLVAFAEAHGAAAGVLHDVELAASEVLTNAIVHGYRDVAGGRVEIVATVGDDRSLDVTIADGGHGIRPGAPSDGLGLGLGLVARLAERFEIRPADPSGTAVAMRFALDG